MRSDRNSFFCGEFVLDSVNMASRDEDNILDQLDEKQSKYVRIFIMNIVISKVIKEKCISKVCYVIFICILINYLE